MSFLHYYVMEPMRQLLAARLAAAGYILKFCHDGSHSSPVETSFFRLAQVMVHNRKLAG